MGTLCTGSLSGVHVYRVVGGVGGAIHLAGKPGLTDCRSQHPFVHASNGQIIGGWIRLVICRGARNRMLLPTGAAAAYQQVVRVGLLAI